MFNNFKIFHRLKVLLFKTRIITFFVCIRVLFLSKLKNNANPIKQIVSITSYGKRLELTLPWALMSILNQSVKPDKIVVWLANGTKINWVLKLFKNKGVRFYFCEDLKSYKKLIPSLKMFPSDNIITADDDIVYPKEWLSQLLQSYKEKPLNIHCHRVHEIITEKNKILPYLSWNLRANVVKDQKRIFPTSGAGILFPPKSLHANVTNADLFLTLCPNADDIWYWAMANLNDSTFSIVPNGMNKIKSVAPYEIESPLWQKNLYEGQNDTQLERIFSTYPKLKKDILELSQ